MSEKVGRSMTKNGINMHTIHFLFKIDEIIVFVIWICNVMPKMMQVNGMVQCNKGLPMQTKSQRNLHYAKKYEKPRTVLVIKAYFV